MAFMHESLADFPSVFLSLSLWPRNGRNYFCIICAALDFLSSNWKRTHFFHSFFVFQELPKAEALLSGRDVNDDDMQSLDNKEKDAETVKQKEKSSDNDSEPSTDNSFSESDEADEMNRVQIKVPLELSLSDIAHSILQQNQK